MMTHVDCRLLTTLYARLSLGYPQPYLGDFRRADRSPLAYVSSVSQVTPLDLALMVPWIEE